jgi:hypothetical protein
MKETKLDMTHSEGGLYSAEVGIGKVAVVLVCSMIYQLCSIAFALVIALDTCIDRAVIAAGGSCGCSVQKPALYCRQ